MPWKLRNTRGFHEDAHAETARIVIKKIAKTVNMNNPPNTSLVKYDNAVLVSKNTDKKTPRVNKKPLQVKYT